MSVRGSVLVAGYSWTVAVTGSARSFFLLSSIFFSLCLLGRRERAAGPVPQV